jgi:hypothetical protein
MHVHVPRIAGNLISILHLVSSNIQIVFDTKGCRVERGGKVIYVVPTKDRMYAWDVRPANNHALSSQRQETKRLDENLLHRRFGHVNMTSLRQTRALVDGLKMDPDTFVSCDSFSLGKMTRRTFKTSKTSPTTFELGELLSVNLFGPLSIESTARVRDTQPTRSGLRSIARERKEGEFYRGREKRSANA